MKEPQVRRCRMMRDKIRSIDDFLALVKGVKRTGEGQWMGLCPGHHDKQLSLSIKEADGKILIKCFAGCDIDGILRSLGLVRRDLFLGVRGSIAGDEPRNRATAYAPQIQPPVAASDATGATRQPQGITLAELAAAKRLPVDFLRNLGLTDFKYNGRPAVRIPYANEVGEIVAVRFRLSLSGDHRFAWRHGDKVLPCGLDRLQDARRQGWILLGEGESDGWTAWHCGLPYLGIPGKGVFHEAWSKYLEGIVIYLWQEPGAEDLALRVAKVVPNLKVITAPEGIKDISEAHIQGLDVVSLLEDLKAKAVSAEDLKARIANARLEELHQQARTVIEADDPLELVEKAIRGLGYGGDIKPAIITYLAATSRLLAMREGAMPVHLLLTGQSAAGKSYTLGITKRLLPPEAYHEIDAGSPHVLIYDGADIAHRVLIFGEADSLPTGEDSTPASAIRNLLQDHYLHYQVTILDKETGDYTVRKVDKPGPTVLITTSTRSLGDQLSTRLFTLEIADSAEQISAALATQAALETEGGSPPDGALVAYQSYLQLKAPWKVVVPFAGELASAMGKMAVAPRILRDFARLLSLIKAVAILRHYRRKVDSEGRILAELADYKTVRELVAEMYAESTSGAVAAVCELVAAVRELDVSRGESERITAAKLAAHLGIHKSTAVRRASKALRQGWIVNHEQRRGRPADYALGDPIPASEGLPTVEDLTGCRVAAVAPNVQPVSEAKTGNGCTVAGLTDGGIPPHTPNNDVLEV